MYTEVDIFVASNSYGTKISVFGVNPTSNNKKEMFFGALWI